MIHYGHAHRRFGRRHATIGTFSYLLQLFKSLTKLRVYGKKYITYTYAFFHPSDFFFLSFAVISYTATTAFALEL